MAPAEDIISLIEKLENPNVAVEQSYCLKVRNRNSHCSRCVDACPAACISIRDNKVSFEAALCMGCLSCTAVCPTGALRPKRQTDAALYSAAADVLAATPGQIVFACEALANAAKGAYDERFLVKVKCVASIDVTALVHWASKGAEALILACGDCANCPMGEKCPGTAQRAVDTANLLLATWNSPARAKVVAKLPSNTRLTEELGYDPKRRGFFSDVRVEARKAAMDAGEVAMERALGGRKEESIISKIKVGANGVLPLLDMPRRRRLLEALDALGEPADEMIGTDLFCQVVIDPEKCKACRICATFCPAGALFKFHTKSGKIGVKQKVRDCVGCRCCTEVCLHGALELYSEVFARDIAEGAVERYEMEQPSTEPRFTFNM